MPTALPKTPAVMAALLRSDFITQRRNRRSVVLVLLVPVMILISWKGVAAKMGAPFVLSTCITIGLIAIGLMGYSNALAGLLKNAETVNASTRLVYFVFIMVGMLGDMGILGAEVKTLVHWSPYGTVKTILWAALQNGGWTGDATLALLATLGYAVVFSFLGIRLFRWNVK